MTLDQQLQDLQRQRRAEIRNLHSTYLRTKRELQRAASPSRILRRHMGISLAAAAALGLFLAPRPGPRESSRAAAPGKQRKKRSIPLRWAKKILNKISPQLGQFIPSTADLSQSSTAPHETHNHHEQHAHEQDERAPKTKRGLLATLLETLLPMFLDKIDWRQFIRQIITAVEQRFQHNGHSEDTPHMSVADAGAIPPHDYENFE